MELREGMAVRVLHTDYPEIPAGTITHIVRVSGANADLWCKEFPEGLYFFRREFEPVAVADSNGNVEHGNRFKVGDRVRALDSCGGGGFVAGDVYTVSRVYEDYSGPRIGVEVDSAGSKTNGWGAWHFELVEAQFTIREGGYYRTRDGRKVGPMENEDCGDGYPWTAENGGYYANNGVRQSGHKPSDLIAEWVDEPAADSSSTTGFTVPLDAPEFGGGERFKVGDRVDILDNHPYSLASYKPTGEIIERSPSWLRGDWQVEIDGYGSDLSFKESELRLVAEATSGKDDDAVMEFKDGKFFLRASQFVVDGSGKDEEPDALARFQLCDVFEAKEMARAGIFTINEVRKKFGLPPISSGDKLAA